MSLLQFTKPNRQVAYAPPQAYTLTIDKNGYIGDKKPADGYTHYCFKEIFSDYSQSGLGQVTPLKYSVIGDKEYVTAIMPDGKEWMAENLDFLPSDGSIAKNPSSIISNAAAWYYGRDEATFGWEGKKYGLLYNWYAAKALTIAGWHLPSTSEWDALATACGGSSVAGTKLKSTTDWSSGNGTDNYGFCAFPAGRYGGSFDFLGSDTRFWTSSEYNSSDAYCRYQGTDAELHLYSSNKSNGFSVRLVKDY